MDMVYQRSCEHVHEFPLRLVETIQKLLKSHAAKNTVINAQCEKVHRLKRMCMWGALAGDKVSPELEAGADLRQHASHSLQRDIHSQHQQREG
jgi:hypothetical protein